MMAELVASLGNIKDPQARMIAFGFVALAADNDTLRKRVDELEARVADLETVISRLAGISGTES